MCVKQCPGNNIFPVRSLVCMKTGKNYNKWKNLSSSNHKIRQDGNSFYCKYLSKVSDSSSSDNKCL